MPKVLVFKETLLPPSETFILAQMKALMRYQSVLAGLERCRPSLLLPPDTLFLTDRADRVASVRAKLYRRTGFAPLFHKKISRTRPDLIHAHFASGGRTAMALAKSLHVPLVVTLHGSDITVRRSKSDSYHELIDQAALFICVSDFIRRQALESGFPAEKLLVHYIGIDRNLFNPVPSSEPSHRVLFIGRLVEKKGCEFLIRAMQLVQGSCPASELTIIGDGPLRRSLEELASSLHIRCTFLGVLPSAAVREVLGKTRVVCVPSITAANGDSEGLPTVIAEAQAMGLPVVASEHAGIPEIVSDGKTGLLTPEGDWNLLADSLRLLLTDKDLWQRFHQAALQRIRTHFDLKTQTALLEDIYTQASTS